MERAKQLISHLYKDKASGQWVIQTNDEHQRGVAEMAASFAEPFGFGSLGRLLGLLHDKGKERDEFQQYIRIVNGLPVTCRKPVKEHHHAFVGGILAKNLMGMGVLNLLINQIISHHTGLHDYVDVERILREKHLPKCIFIDDIDPFLSYSELRESSFFRTDADMKDLHHLSRMLFSCLVDADRLDTERFMDVESWQKRGSPHDVADLLPKLETYLQRLRSDSDDTNINRLRHKVQ